MGESRRSTPGEREGKNEAEINQDLSFFYLLCVGMKLSNSSRKGRAKTWR